MTTQNQVIEVNESKEFMQAEWNRRMDLVNDIKFRETCAEGAKELGITSKEWNTNRAAILLMFANKFCAIENNNERALVLNNF